jgi:hypothetical protein
MRGTHRIRNLVAAATLVATSGCGGVGLGDLGTLADILVGGGAAGAGQGQVVVEVQQIDTRQQLIQVRTQEGQTGSVSYDANTMVVYQQQQYPVTALERGDIVALQLQERSQGGYYASRIDVQQSVRERTGQVAGQAQQFAGQVGQIDHSRGIFELRMQAGTVTVTLPFNAPQATVQHFNSLRTGHTVRIEGQHLGDGRVELHRFL